MKAVILAAGKGQRLGSITESCPKPMIEVKGKPVLEHNIDMCRGAGIKDIYINLHHLPEYIRDYFGDGSKHGLNINYNYEPELLGTAGALIPFRDFLKGEPFFVIYGDNYIPVNLLEIKSFNDKKKADVTILFHWRDNVSSSGIANFDKNDQINRFIEKPIGTHKNGNWVNAGIYYFQRSDVLEQINLLDDFGFNVFPRLLKQDYNVFGLKSSKDLIAIDTPELLKKYKN